MKNYFGVKVFEGYACNEIKVIAKKQETSKREFTTEDQEFAMFVLARAKTVASLDELFVKTLNQIGKAKAAIFETHKLMAEDLDFEDLVRSKIADGNIVEDALDLACEELAANFLSLEDEYMRARAADVREVSNSIKSYVLGEDKLVELTKPTIIVCEDLDSSLLMKFNHSLIAGIVFTKGNVTSHVSILTRSLEIPAICSVKDLDVTQSLNGKIAILNAISGKLIIEPDNETVARYSKISQDYWAEIHALKQFKGKETVTKDGFKLKLYANIAGSNEVSTILKNDAEGVGLFRSEFIYLKAKDYPTEEEQFGFYKAAVEGMKGKEVIIRTFDIGADKKVPYFDLPPEDNPALGYRSIRICKNRPEMFKTQLRALYRASVFGKLSIMVPMIISCEEVIFTKNLIREVWEELDKENIPYKKDVKLGIMIETPAAALISDQLAKLVDFFSIGTNDLSQYTLACDRLNSTLNKTFDPHHKAILRLIKMTVENAHKEGKTVGMCGELARDKQLLPFWIGLKFDELSCSSAYILDLRKLISEIDSSKVKLEDYID